MLAPGSRDALATALPTRPDLRAFESQRQMAEYSVALANADWKPTLSLIGNMAYQDDERRALLRQDNQNYTFGVALRMPLLAAPGAAARRGAAEAQVRQAEHGLRAALDAGRLELETAWTDLEAATEVVATQQKALELARESVDDRAGLLRERGHHLGRADRRAGGAAADGIPAAAGQVRPHLAAARARFAAGVSCIERQWPRLIRDR